MISNYYLLPEFTPARLQDLVLWYESTSFRGNTWYNLAPCYSDRNHGTAHGGVGLSTWHPQFSPAPTFDGVNDYVNVPDDDSLDITDEITIEAWVKILNLDTANRIVSKRRGMKSAYDFSFRGDASKRLNIYFNDGENMDNLFSAPNVITDTLLHHAVVVRNDYNVEFFVDVVPVGTAIAQYDMITLEYPVLIGCLAKAISWFYGIIPLVRIYKVALTDDEIRHNYTHHLLYYIGRGIDPYEFIKRKKFYFL